MKELGRRLWRALVWFGVALLGVYACYLLGMLAVLNSAPMRRVMNPHPDKVTIGWSWAFSPWPGRVRVHDLSIVGRGFDVEWELRVDEASGWVALSPLPLRIFKAHDVSAHGASLRLRPTILPTEEALRQARSFPPIPGAAEIPIRREGPLPPPPPHSWTVRLHNARFDGVRELWVAAYRLQTDGVVQGDLNTHAGWNIAFDADGALQIAKVLVGEDAVARDGEVKLSARMELPKIVGTSPADRIKTLDGTIDGRMKHVSLALIGQHALSAAGDVGGEGELEVKATLRRDAKLAPGSKLSLRGTDGRVRIDEAWSLAAPSWSAEGEVATRDGHPEAELRLKLTEVALIEDGQRLLRSPEVELVFGSVGATLLDRPKQYGVRAFIAKTDPAPLSRFRRWVGTRGLVLDRGTVQLHAGAAMSNGKELEGDVHLAVQGLHGKLRDSEIGGSAFLHVNLENFRMRSGVADLSGSRLRLEGISVVGQRSRVDGWSANVALSDATLRPRTMRLSADVAGDCTDARPFLVLAGDKLPGWAARFFVAKGLRLQGHLELDDGDLALPHFHASGEGLTIDGGLVRKDGALDGAVMARVRGVPFGVKIDHGKPHMAAAFRNEWLDARLEERGVKAAGTGGAGAFGTK